MEYIIIIIISILAIVLLKIGLNIHIKDIKNIKELGYNKELNKIAGKFPENKEICRAILKTLKNEEVTIEETADSKTSLYIALTNKIIIANIKDTFTRIQTIAHECLHSIQNRRILLFNFAFSNFNILYFIVAIFLILFNIGNSMLYIVTWGILTLIYITVRGYLENEAMSKAPYVAKAYMQEYQKQNKNITEADINTLAENFETLNKIGIPFTNFYIVVISLVKMIFLCILALI